MPADSFQEIVLKLTNVSGPDAQGWYTCETGCDPRGEWPELA